VQIPFDSIHRNLPLVIVKPNRLNNRNGRGDTHRGL